LVSFVNLLHRVRNLKIDAAITVAPDGSVLAATGFGVVGWKDQKKQILNARKGLPWSEVNGLISDDAGDLWPYAHCGLIEIGNDQMQLWWEQPDRKLKPRVFDTFDGVQPAFDFFNNSAKTPDEITHGERAFRLRVRGDGDGIPTQILEEGRPGHYSLSGMRERANQIGGKLELWSRAGAGTEIDLSIPGSVAYRTALARPLFSLFSLFGRKPG
jgi:hypothetical protein